MAAIDADAAAAELLQPVWATLQRGLAQLPAGASVPVSVGPVDGFYALEDGRAVLSELLVSGLIHHPDEQDGPLPPLDRWRRAAASVLECASLLELSRRSGMPPGSDWRWQGGAIHAADAVAPELGLAGPDLALAITTGNPGEHPRAGLAVMRAWAASDVDPIKQTAYLLGGGVVSPPEWLRLGAWVFSPRGGLGALPVRVTRVPDVDVPVDLPPWSWRMLRVPAHARGGRIEAQGPGAIEEPWARAGETLSTLIGAADGPCRFVPDPGGPVGSWEVASAEGFGQVMGARGISFEFRADGRLQLVLADAAVGPLAAVAMAEEVGTSGVTQGRWRVDGRFLLRFEGIESHNLTMHGRRGQYLVPAQGFGLGQWLQALTDDAWAWQPAGPGRMVLRGRMLGGEVEVRLRAAEAADHE